MVLSVTLNFSIKCINLFQKKWIHLLNIYLQFLISLISFIIVIYELILAVRGTESTSRFNHWLKAQIGENDPAVEDKEPWSQESPDKNQTNPLFKTWKIQWLAHVKREPHCKKSKAVKVAVSDVTRDPTTSQRLHFTSGSINQSIRGY